MVAEEETTHTKLMIHAWGFPNIQVHVVWRLTFFIFFFSVATQSGVVVYYSNKTDYMWLAESNAG